jgi:hypothetical protein
MSLVAADRMDTRKQLKGKEGFALSLEFPPEFRADGGPFLRE